MKNLLITDIDWVFYSTPFMAYLSTPYGLTYKESLLDAGFISPLSPDCVSRFNILLEAVPDLSVIIHSTWAVLELKKEYSGLVERHLKQAGLTHTDRIVDTVNNVREHSLTDIVFKLEDEHNIAILSTEEYSPDYFDQCDHRIYNYVVDPNRGFDHKTLITLKSFYGDV